MPIRLLLIEDNPGDALIFREKLAESDLDYEIIHAQRLEEGLELTRAQPFDLILVDLSLPDAAGLEAVVRVVQAAPEQPVVVLTGLDDASIAAQARHAGAIDYLVKWYLDGPTMARYIQYAIAQRRVQHRGRLQPEPADAAGEPDAAASDGRDAEQRRASATADPLRAALDPLPDAIAVVLTDGSVLYANECARALLGEAGRLPWGLREGHSRVRARGGDLDQVATPTRWQDRPAFALTLRPASDAAAAPEGALIEAAEASLAFVAQAERRHRWMAGLLRNALDLEQAVRGEVPPSPSRLDLVERVNIAVRELRPLALERGTPLQVKASRERIATTADRQLLDTLLRRLLLDSLLSAGGAGVDVAVSLAAGQPQVIVRWELSLPDWAALPATTRALSRRILEHLVLRAGGECGFSEEGQQDVVTITLPPGGNRR